MKIKHSINGSISLLAIVTLVTASLGGAYYLLDQKADKHAQESLSRLVDDAQSKGVELKYKTVDASPLTRSISITNFEIKGKEQEPDINLGNIKITGFNWQNLNNKQSQLPPKMTISINNGTLDIKPSMSANDANLEALVATFGEKLHFSTQLAYDFNQDKGVLNISTSEILNDNFHFNTKLSFGGTDWLAEINTTDTKNKPMSDMMKTTLNSLSITFKNDGIIEKIRSVATKRTGQTQEQLTKEAVANMQQLRIVAEKNWGPVFVPMIDELIKFAKKPEQLHLAINPAKPLDSNTFMLAMMGGDAALLDLIKKAQIKIVAN